MSKESLIAHAHLRLDDDTLWPNPYYQPPDDSNEAWQQQIKSMCNAYISLTTHPWGATGSEVKMRLIRRAIRKELANDHQV